MFGSVDQSCRNYKQWMLYEIKYIVILCQDWAMFNIEACKKPQCSPQDGRQYCCVGLGGISTGSTKLTVGHSFISQIHVRWARIEINSSHCWTLNIQRALLNLVLITAKDNATKHLHSTLDKTIIPLWNLTVYNPSTECVMTEGTLHCNQC